MSADSDTVAFAKKFAGAVVARDFDTAGTMLAPWVTVRLPDTSLKKLLRRAREDRPQPHSFGVSENSAVTLEDLSDELPAGGPITGENFRGWLCVEFYPDPELEAAVDLSYVLWIAVVALEKGLAIGYLEPAA